ncbi:MAG TPA: two-component regulator propeller domain-containing protein, partial [Puia sp.]|nr:two-component regulator propeller domain-containing protein [Puia sp.]
MTFHKHLITASLAAYFSITQAVAQINNTEPIFYPITEQNGLSDDVVTCFFQDSRNFMWIGTQDGLNIYDGSVFKIYRASNNKSRDELADNLINTVAEDAHKHIW